MAYKVKEAKVIIYGSLTQSSDHAGGISVAKEAYHRHLLERHQTYQSARHSFKFWVSHFNDPRATQFNPDPLKTPEVAAPMQFGSNICSSDFSNLAARKIDSDAILELKFKEEPFSVEVVRTFQQQRDWRDVLLSWAYRDVAEFTPLFRSSDYEAASRSSRLFLEGCLPESDFEAPF